MRMEMYVPLIAGLQGVPGASGVQGAKGFAGKEVSRMHVSCAACDLSTVVSSHSRVCVVILELLDSLAQL